ncbi:hypothetical protein C8R41DRAFT_71811 [Lentinula lateritia]|uniref:Extracellular membrane protein CFEM domain-containing protein n=1 Tax=Lentinula lateritia TaxID=40482 RepID=A0ABQ8UZ57_9AGAR|nr:hypothetical protein C8R41DRAFT_71811 [Lentinula lateritia]
MSSFTLFLAFLIVFSSSVIQLHGRPVKSLTTAELLTNAQLAQQLNAAFQSLSSGDACTSGEVACINGEAAECSGTKWKTAACIATQACFAVPSVNKANDAVLRCTSQRSAESIIAASGASGGLTGSNSTSTSTSSNSTSTASSSANSTSFLDFDKYECCCFIQRYVSFLRIQFLGFSKDKHEYYYSIYLYYELDCDHNYFAFRCAQYSV